jgi:hypothetical protein
MGTKISTAGGTTVSFGNTPQAQNDSFVQMNDAYALDAILKFDVMANDLGGNAKSLYSVDDGTGVPTTDLLDPDKDHALEAGQFGCQIQVTGDGQLGVKLTQTFLDYLGTIDAGTFTTINFTYAIQLGNGTLSWATASIQFEGTKELPPPENTEPDPATALSHGYWMNHDFSDSEGFAAAVGDTTFDAFFGLDNPDGRTWEDQTTGGKFPNIDSLADLTFDRAVAFGNGAGASGDITISDPIPTGNYQDLVREAATAVLNFYDADNSQSFVDWYIYERNLTDNDANAANNPIDAAGVLADLKEQVQAAMAGDADAYSVEDLANLLHNTHE